jgi:hypothetical protein
MKLKKLARRRFLQLAVGAAALPALPHIASAQAAYPSKPVTIVVPYAPGGPTDTIARILSERLRISLGQTIVVENTTGAAAPSRSAASPVLRPTATPSALGRMVRMSSPARPIPSCRTIC